MRSTLLPNVPVPHIPVCRPGNPKPRHARSRGVTLWYFVAIMVVLIAFASLAVDFGRVQLAKTELRRATDAAALAGAEVLGTGVGNVRLVAKQYAKYNLVNAEDLLLQDADIKIGIWNASARTFTAVPDNEEDRANAVQVNAHRNAARGGGIPLMFAAVLGKSFCDVNASATVMLAPAINVNQNVLATANPFLAGMPKGTLGSIINPSPRKIPDVAGDRFDWKNSPTPIAMGVNGGDAFTFDSIDGTARHDPNLAYIDPDGDLSENIGHNNLTTSYGGNYGTQMYNENGIADAWIPINSLVGIFLDDNAPTNTSVPTPENLDFRTPESRNQATYQPKLKQMFFIGDGKMSNGANQKFVAPTGATRLYLATMDYYEWNNNAGFRNILINRPSRVMMVQ